MRKLSVWNPERDWDMFRDFDKLQSSMNSLFSDFGRTRALSGSAEAFSSSFSPACDIEESAGHYVLSFDLPGLSKDDIQINVQEGQLTVSGERKEERKTDDKFGKRIERSYGSFERSFSLPPNVDADNVEANYENGVLTLAVPKAETVKPKEIKVTEGRSGFMERIFGKKPELKSTGN